MAIRNEDLGLVSREGVCHMLRISMGTLDRLIKEGKFPHGVRLGATTRSRIVWKIEIVEAWIKKNQK